MAKLKLLLELLIQLLPVLFQCLLITVILFISKKFLEVSLGQDSTLIVTISTILLFLKLIGGWPSAD